jgi:hypothetical protein
LVLALAAYLSEVVQLILQLLLVVELSIELPTLELGPLLPPVDIETLVEHQTKLHDLLVVSFVD